MPNVTKWEMDYCLDRLDKKESVLFYGKRENTLALMKGIYDIVKLKEEYLCSWHDASTIIHQLDLFEPILKLKYGNEYTLMKETSSFKKLYDKKNAKEFLNMGDVSRLVELCGQEIHSDDSNKRKLPVIFIDGIDELFFKMDYAHLDEAGLEKLFTGNYLERPHHKGFGNCLRDLHQYGTAIFYGIVKDKDSVAYRATLGDSRYLFYAENFRNDYLC
jgi:hypothetical protein